MSRSRIWRILAIVVGISILIIPLTQVRVSISSQEKSTVSETENLSRSNTFTPTTYIYFPLAFREYLDWQSPIGAQYYSRMDESVKFDLMAEAQTGWVRYPVGWNRVEPVDTDPQNYNWYAMLDQSIANAWEADIQVILTIVGQPEWAADYPMGPPHDEEALFEFIEALVERYDGDGVADAPGSPIVRHFELYNEPDGTDPYRGEQGTHGYWGYKGTEYAELLQKVYPVVKEADSEAKLVMGGIALDWFVEDGGIFDGQFLGDVLAACRGKMCFDVVNFHYYPLFKANWASYGYGIIGKTTYVRQKMAEYGMEDLSVICTEMGWAGSEDAGWGGEEAQARYAVQGFVRGLSVDLSTMIWFRARDASKTGGQSGLLDVDLNPKPSYHAFKTTIRELAGLEFARELTQTDTGSEHVEGYRFQNNSGRRVDVVWTADNTAFDPHDNPVVEISVSTTSINVVDKFGNERTILDEDDGKVDGKVQLQLDGSPLFLEY